MIISDKIHDMSISTYVSIFIYVKALERAPVSRRRDSHQVVPGSKVRGAPLCTGGTSPL